MAEKLKPCAKCGQLKTNKELFVYVDGNNFAITNSSPAFCKKCYSEQYPNDSLRDNRNFLRWALTCHEGGVCLKEGL